MACDKCVSEMRNAIGNPVECQCDYCGASFIIGKPDLCVTCYWYWSSKTDEGYRYMCHKQDTVIKNGKCMNYSKDYPDISGGI
jgi:hypothetical protein